MTSNLVYFVYYIILWKNWQYYIFAHFEEEKLVGNKHNAAEYESFLASIDELYTYDDPYGGYISMNALEEIWDEKKRTPR